MAQKTIPDDWEDIKNAIVDFVDGVLKDPTVTTYWELYDAAPPPCPRVSLRDAVPEMVGSDTLCEITDCAIRVVSAQDLTDYTVIFGGISYAYTSTASATIESIRDGLISMINGLSGVGFTAFPFDDETLRLEPTGISQLSLDVDDSADLLYLESVEVYAGPRILPISVEVYTVKEVQDAGPIVSKLMAAAKLDPYRVPLLDCGISVQAVDGPRNQDENVGGVWLDRAGFDLRLRLVHKMREATPYIEVTTIKGTVTGGSEPPIKEFEHVIE